MRFATVSLHALGAAWDRDEEIDPAPIISTREALAGARGAMIALSIETAAVTFLFVLWEILRLL